MLRKNQPTKREFLVYCALKNGECEAELFGRNRLFDVALNDYGDVPKVLSRAEWQFTGKTEKLIGALLNLPKINKEYSIYAFIDDDLKISCADLNRTFLIGKKHQLDLFQPALTRNSIYSHAHTVQSPKLKGIREVPFVEVMMPFFSSRALAVCYPSFGESPSSWGLDKHAWPVLLYGTKLWVIDSVAAQHLRPLRSRKPENAFNPNARWDLDNMRRKYRESGKIPKNPFIK